MFEEELQADYKNRINRVFEFIDENIKADLSSLELLKSLVAKSLASRVCII